MKFFLLDDSEALGRYIYSATPAGGEWELYCVDPSYYAKAGSVDDFFLAIMGNAWRTAADAPASGGTSLISLASHPSERCLFLIHVNLTPTKLSLRQDEEGIELLKHIRLTEELGDRRNTHVVLYAFEDQLELLKRKPGNLIMLSEGVTFLRLPGGLNQMANPAELCKLADERADVYRNDFKRFIRCDYQPGDAAHEFSNWWGLREIALARRADMPAIVVKNLRLLENKKTRLLFDPRDVQIGETPFPNLGPGAASSFEIVHIDDEAAWGKCLRRALRDHFNDKVNVDYLLPPTLDILSDDGKLKGWTTKHVLSKATSGTERRGTSFADLRSATHTARSLVLLDLRLLGKDEASVAVSESSGATVAEAIRKLDPGLPIILMTASNKAYTFEAAMKIGIDGYWMKGGVGEHAPQGGGRENYIELLTMICSALGAEYQFLRRFSRSVSNLKDDEDKQWWERYSWKTRSGTETTETDKEVLCRVLNGIVILLREYLRLFKMDYGFRGEDDAIRQSWLSALIVEAVKVLELVHRLDLRAEDFALLLGGLRRKDWWGKLINAQRRHAAHALGGATSLEFVHAKSVLSGILTYLMFSPKHSQRARDIHLTDDYIYLHGDSIFHSVRGVDGRE